VIHIHSIGGAPVRTQVRSLSCELLEARRLLSSTIYVDIDAPGPAHDGTSWNGAFVNIQQAVAAALIGDQIRVANGTYVSIVPLQMRDGVALYGGYAGWGSADPDLRDVERFATTLAGNANHVVTATADVDRSAILDGFSITGGNAPGFSDGGGGLLVDGGSPIVRDCIFFWNYGYRGGAIYNRNGASPVFEACEFISNRSGAWGGGAVHNSGSSPTFEKCLFKANRATSLGLARGGAVYDVSSFSVLIRCTFVGNTAVIPIEQGGRISNGGALAAEWSSPTLIDCTFSRNTAIVTLSQYSFLAGGGGAIWSSQCRWSMFNCAFYGNSAQEGGALDIQSSSIDLTNCAFVGNAADRAGALSLHSGPSILRNNTISGNSGRIGVGGIIVAEAADAILVNSIVWGNTAPPSNAVQVDGLFTSTYSDVEGGAAGIGNVDRNPLFVRHPSPGPDEQWGTPDDDWGDVRLSAYSPVVDAGDRNSLPSQVVTDLQGNPRFVDVPTTPDTGIGSTPALDLGAYEASATLQAHAGGPYVVLEGHSIRLDGHGASAATGTLAFAWEWDGDDLFDDATGSTPTFNAKGKVVAAHEIAVRVTDSLGKSVIATSELSVVPVIMYVDARAPDSGDGTSWLNAENDLASVLRQAPSGQQIRVAAGLYKPTSGNTRASTFQLKDGVTLLGSYAGAGAPDPDARQVKLHPSVLSGDIGSFGSMADNSFSVVNGSGVHDSAILDGFVVTGGNGTYGAGLHIEFGTPNIVNCIFSGNIGSNGGGVSNIESAAPTFLGCTFRDNVAYSGGAMYNYRASPKIIDCTFMRNSSDFRGGAMYDEFSASQVQSCTFTGNTAKVTAPQLSNGQGGAIFVVDSALTLANCLFVGNFAKVTGGAMHTERSTPLVTNCTFVQNLSNYRGGAIYNFGTSQVANCVFQGNTDAAGLELYVAVGMATIMFSDVRGGWSGQGNIDADPVFVRPPASGPDNLWGTADDDYGDLRLRYNSPCLDAGSNAAVPADVTTDLGGNPRFIDVPGAHDPGAIVDMGAYEYPLPLAAAGGDYLFDAPRPAARVQFNGDVAPETVSAADLLLLNLTTNQSIDMNALAVASYDAATRSATWSFPSSVLPDGNYRATLPATSVRDALGNAMAQDVTFDFFVLGGDANQDRLVNLADFNILAPNFGQSPRSFSQGDFNYDGLVNLADFNLLASRFGQSLAPFTFSGGKLRDGPTSRLIDDVLV
jgi:hypothetical protein